MKSVFYIDLYTRPGVYVDAVFGQDNCALFVYNALKYIF